MIQRLILLFDMVKVFFAALVWQVVLRLIKAISGHEVRSDGNPMEAGEPGADASTLMKPAILWKSEIPGGDASVNKAPVVGLTRKD